MSHKMLYESPHYSDCPDWPPRHFALKDVAGSRTGEVKHGPTDNT